MDEQEQPMDDDNGAWAHQLELEQQYLEGVNNDRIKSKETNTGNK
jgi:hypothetical protein